MSSENRVLDHIFVCTKKGNNKMLTKSTLDKSFENQNLDFFLKKPRPGTYDMLHRAQVEYAERPNAGRNPPFFWVRRWLPFFINLPYFWGTALVGKGWQYAMVTHYSSRNAHCKIPLSNVNWTQWCVFFPQDAEMGFYIQLYWECLDISFYW